MWDLAYCSGALISKLADAKIATKLISSPSASLLQLSTTLTLSGLLPTSFTPPSSVQPCGEENKNTCGIIDFKLKGLTD